MTERQRAYLLGILLEEGVMAALSKETSARERRRWRAVHKAAGALLKQKPRQKKVA